MSTSTQAIKLDYNRLSCPTPSNQFRKDNSQIQMGKIRLLNKNSIWFLSEGYILVVYLYDIDLFRKKLTAC
jgi:hypothetical protein